jgi:hypothetical protein
VGFIGFMGFHHLGIKFHRNIDHNNKQPL